jgi:Flp pilus assembly CpaF family ATPase
LCTFTLLNILSLEIPPQERVLTVEEAAELRLTNVVVQSAPPSSLDQKVP